jgi:hypothetical protein
MNWRTLALVVGLLGTAALIQAQTPVTRGPVTTTNRFQWIAPTGISQTDHSTFEVRLRDTTVPTVVTVIQNATCALVNSQLQCERQLTQQNVDALNMVGIHNLTMAYFRADVGEGPQSSPFVLTSPAGAPTALRIVP